MPHDDEHRSALCPQYLTEAEYCDYCEQEGHTFRTCPQRDDS